jgi:hypothetical protein
MSPVCYLKIVNIHFLDVEFTIFYYVDPFLDYPGGGIQEAAYDYSKRTESEPSKGLVLTSIDFSDAVTNITAIEVIIARVGGMTFDVILITIYMIINEKYMLLLLIPRLSAQNVPKRRLGAQSPELVSLRVMPTCKHCQQ